MHISKCIVNFNFRFKSLCLTYFCKCLCCVWPCCSRHHTPHSKGVLYQILAVSSRGNNETVATTTHQLLRYLTPSTYTLHAHSFTHCLRPITLLLILLRLLLRIPQLLLAHLHRLHHRGPHDLPAASSPLLHVIHVPH